MQDTQIIERTTPTETAATVGAIVLGTVAAGVGALILFAIAAYYISGGDWRAVLGWGVTAGSTVTGALLFVRFGTQEAIDAADYRRLISDLQAERDDNADLRATVASLQRDLIAANAYLDVRDHNGPRRVLRNTPSNQATQEVRDAITLISRHFAEQRWPARDRSGLTPARWNAAYDVLLAHGVVARQNKTTAVLATSLAEALAVLEGPKS